MIDFLNFEYGLYIFVLCIEVLSFSDKFDKSFVNIVCPNIDSKSIELTDF